ncbi:MAG: malectin domain-containing carbohydrate-binding protein [Bryobacteraceae bacterium]
MRSRLLTRSPSVLKIAEYIVQKYLQGEAASLKEYNIAVDALGKPAEFDPKRDSIVRVEAHRLRKKLTEFYQTEGADHILQVVIDPGNYTPRFVPKIPTEPAPEITETSVPAIVPVLAPPVRTRRSRGWVVVVFALALSAFGFLVWRSRSSPPPAPVESVRLAAGAPDYVVVVSATGDRWRGDSWFKGGKEATNGKPVDMADEVPLNFQRQGNFDYAIPLSKVPYELRLYFTPRMVAGEPGTSAHGFDVLANGIKLLDSLEPGVSRRTKGDVITRVFHDIGPAPDGLLHLSFRSGSEMAYVNAVELTPGEVGKLTPIRLIAKNAPYTQPNGITWAADRYSTAGVLTLRSEHLRDTLDQNLMSGERYGTFTYEIPVSKGHYGLKLYFAETWFGSNLNGGGAGSRRFDVRGNGVPLLVDFDIFQTAGQRNRLVIKEFHGLTPDADGYIVLDFAPRVNNACINALELDDEGR